MNKSLNKKIRQFLKKGYTSMEIYADLEHLYSKDVLTKAIVEASKIKLKRIDVDVS